MTRQEIADALARAVGFAVGDVYPEFFLAFPPRPGGAYGHGATVMGTDTITVPPNCPLAQAKAVLHVRFAVALAGIYRADGGGIYPFPPRSAHQILLN